MLAGSVLAPLRLTINRSIGDREMGKEEAEGYARPSAPARSLRETMRGPLGQDDGDLWTRAT